MSVATLDLLVPGLTGPWPPAQLVHVCEDLKCAALARVLVRGSRDTCPVDDGSLAGVALAAYGFEPGVGAAGFSARCDERDCAALAGAGEPWLRADPVHLEAGLHGAQITYGQALDLSEPDASALAAQVSAIDGRGGPVVADPARWYLPGGALDLGVAAPSAASGPRAGSALPRGDEGSAWRAWLTEAQMVLHASVVNERREAAGLPSINSLWLWGGGTQPATVPRRYTHVFSDDPVTCGLALSSAAPVHGTPRAFDELDAVTGGNGQVLVQLDDAHGLAEAGAVERWRAVLAALDDGWIAPAEAAVRTGKLHTLSLHLGAGDVLRVTRSSVWRLWRSQKPLNIALAAFNDHR